MKKAIKLGIISSVFILYLAGGAYWFNSANKQNTVELFGISPSIDSLYDIPDSVSFNYRPIEIDKVPGIRLESKKKEPSLYYHSNEKIVLTAKDRECLLKNIFYYGHIWIYYSNANFIVNNGSTQKVVTRLFHHNIMQNRVFN